MKKALLFILTLILIYSCKKNDVIQPNTLNVPAIQFSSITKYIGDPEFKVDFKSQSDAPIKLSSSNLGVATVTNDVIKIIGVGESAIGVLQEANDKFSKVDLKTLLTVRNRVKPSLTDFNDLTKQVGSPKFKITPPKSNSSGTFQYTVSDPLIAKISGDSLQVLKVGQVKLTAKQSQFGEFSESEIISNLNVINSVSYDSKKLVLSLSLNSFLKSNESIYDFDIDSQGNIYYASYEPISGQGKLDFSIKRINTNSSIEVLASRKFQYISSIKFGLDNNLYICDKGENKIFKMSTSGVLSLFSGSGRSEYLDGIGSNSSYSSPNDINFDSKGNLIVADFNNHVIRRITPNGTSSTIAGIPKKSGFLDGNLENSLLTFPTEVIVDANDNIFIADQSGLVIRKINVNGIVETYLGDGVKGTFDGKGNKARFMYINNLFFDKFGNLLVSDYDFLNNKLRYVNESGVITTSQNILNPSKMYFAHGLNNNIFVLSGGGIFKLTD